MSKRSDDVIQDPVRLEALRSTELLDSTPDPRFDRLTQLAANLLHAPVALVSLVDHDRQFFKSSTGLPEPWATLRETPLSHSFCKHVVTRGRPLVIPDARQDPLVSGNAAVVDLGVVAYLGMPLVTVDGAALGSFCVIDGEPRDWKPHEVETLHELAEGVLSQILLLTEKRRLQLAQARLRVQCEIMTILSEQTEMPLEIGRLLGIIGSGLGYDVAEYWSADHATGSLSLHASSWSANESGAAFVEASRGLVFGPGVGLPGQVQAQMRPVTLQDASLDRTLVRWELAKRYSLRSAIGFPVQDFHRLLGVVTLYSRDANRVEAELPQVLSSLGKQIGQNLGRRWVAKRLREQDSLLDDLLDQIPLALFLKDQAGRFLRVNRAFGDLVGVPPERLVGKTDFDLFPTDTAEAHRAADREVLESRQSIENERSNPYADGIHDIIVRKSPFYGGDGTLVGLLGVITDITKWKQAEKVANEVSTRLEQVANNLRGAIVYQAIESPQERIRFIWMSQGIEALIGIPTREVVNDLEKLLQYADPEDALEHRRRRHAAIESGTPFEILVRFHLPGGETRWIQDHCSPLPQKDGSTLWHGVAVDVTARELAKQKLAEQELMLRQLGDNLPNGAIFRCVQKPDQSFRFTYLSAGFEKVVGISAADMLRNPLGLEDRMPPDDAARIAAAREAAFRNLEPFDHEYRIVFQDGMTRWFQMRVVPHREPDGLTTWDGVIIDISATKAGEEALRLAKEQAEAASRAKSEFLANMSHEVRTPLSAVLGYADMLLDPRLPHAAGAVAVQAIRRNGTHLLGILDNILDLAKVEAGQLELEPILLSPWQAILEVESLLSVRAAERRITLRIKPVASLPEFAILDPTRVRQILINLLNNAIKFSKAGGEVELRVGALPAVEGEPAALKFQVHDQGIGMTPEQLERIFLPFQQADTSTTRRFGGTGLGLSITTRLVKAMGGSIEARSELGRGSHFTVRLPLQLPADESSPRWFSPHELATVHVEPLQASAFHPHQQFRGRVLVADDSEDNRRVLLHILSRFGIDADAAPDGREALDKALHEPYDVILMDMQMPEMDGYAATQSLRRSGYPKPIVALTAHALSQDREKCLQIGCTDYLSKPVNVRLLGEILAKYLDTVVEPAPEGTAPIGAALTAEMPTAPILPDYAADPTLLPLIRDYVAELPSRIAELRQALEAGMLDRVSSLAHQLRGVGGSYGYPALTESGGLIEDAIREGQPIELIAELVAELEDLLPRILVGIRQV